MARNRSKILQNFSLLFGSLVHVCRWLLTLGLALPTVPGCAAKSNEVKFNSAEFDQKFDQLRVGLTEKDVATLLGESPLRSSPAAQPGNDAFAPIFFSRLLASDAAEYKYWVYGDSPQLEDNLLEPSHREPPDHAYVVYFDSSGHVTKWRQPINRRAGYYFEDVSDRLRIGEDCLESWYGQDRPKGPRSPTLKPPLPISPPNRSVFHHYPRELILHWMPGPQTPFGTKYLVEMDENSNDNFTEFRNWSNHSWPTWTYLTGKRTMNIRHVGDQPGRWRVKALDQSGESAWSDWQYFRFDCRLPSSKPGRPAAASQPAFNRPASQNSE